MSIQLHNSYEGLMTFTYYGVLSLHNFFFTLENWTETCKKKSKHVSFGIIFAYV